MCHSSEEYATACTFKAGVSLRFFSQCKSGIKDSKYLPQYNALSPKFGVTLTDITFVCRRSIAVCNKQIFLKTFAVDGLFIYTHSIEF
jgi:hypothetical protein